MELLLRILLCIIFPPLAVFDRGCGAMLLTLFFTLLGWIPGVIAALIFSDEEMVPREKIPELIIRYIVCIIFPPLAVADKGCLSMLAVLLFTIFGWLPGVILALFLCLDDRKLEW